MINLFGAKKEKRLEGRIALITGASRGIGAAVAQGFAREGAHVILLARTVGGLEEIDDRIQKEGRKATLLPFDLAQTDKISAIGPTIAERFGRLDILVGNAAILGDLSPVAMSDAKTWEKVMKINLMANYHLIGALDPLLRGSHAGRAIFVTSRVAQKDVNKPYWGAYAVSKSALEKMAMTYAEEVAHSPLRVNILDPGVIRTDMRAQAMPGEDPQTLPPPESIVEKFIELATPSFDETGLVVKAA